MDGAESADRPSPDLSRRREGGFGDGEGLRFAGYAAVFDAVDRGGDVVRRGAFGALKGRQVPLLWQHRPDTPLGYVETLAEDARGLRVVARVSGRTAAGRAAMALLRAGAREGRAMGGLSFGYRVKAARGARPRELLALDLVEVSLVRAPMQPLARVVAVEG